MYRFFAGLVFISLLSHVALAKLVWPILGPAYPPPKDISSRDNPAAAGWNEAIFRIETYLSGKRLPPNGDALSDHSFSIMGFSVGDSNARATLEFHYDSPGVREITESTRKVDGDTIYRIASISKLFTVYLALIKLGHDYWHRPVTGFIPYLSTIANDSTSSAIRGVDWSSVTLGSLASQMSGITRDIYDLASVLPGAEKAGLPPLENDSALVMKACLEGLATYCPPEVFMQQIIDRSPTYAPWTTPIDSNSAFNVLAFALENITGKAFADLAKEDLFDPLGLTSSGLGLPPDPSLALVTKKGLVNWMTYTGNTSAAGGFYSSANDLSKLGISILNSTLLRRADTRRWLHPISHTATLQASVGMPWEIARFQQPQTGRINDLYTKIGDVPDYDSLIALSPDHDAGYVVLTAGERNDVARTRLADILATSFLPGLEAAAAAEAAAKYAGMYRSADQTLNSTLTLAVDPGRAPGLIVESWTSAGIDTLAGLAEWAGQKEPFGASLYPTNLEVDVDASGGDAAVVSRHAFRAAVAFDPQDELGPISYMHNRGSWTAVDDIEHGRRDVDLFVFNIAADGRVVSVTLPGFKVTLTKVRKFDMCDRLRVAGRQYAPSWKLSNVCFGTNETV